ncbi:MAG: hypothetical protein ROR55_09760 [Devosia sp.]
MTDDRIDLPHLAEVLGLPLDDARLAEVAEAFKDIRAAIEALRAQDLGETHPAVVFRPVGERE